MAEVEAHYDKMSIRTQKRSKYTYLKAKESSLSSTVPVHFVMFMYSFLSSLFEFSVHL